MTAVTITNDGVWWLLATVLIVAGILAWGYLRERELNREEGRHSDDA